MINNSENGVKNDVTAIAGPLLDQNGMELVDIEYRKEGIGKVLRLFIDKPGGINVEDCASISRELSTIMDVNGTIDERYVLEVSSPGLRRPLKKLEDFEKYKGNLVLVKTNELIDNRKVFKGYLKKTSKNGIEMEIDGKLYNVPFDQIKKANLEIDF